MQVSPFIVGQQLGLRGKGEQLCAMRNHLLTNVSDNSGCGRERGWNKPSWQAELRIQSTRMLTFMLRWQ